MICQFNNTYQYYTLISLCIQLQPSRLRVGHHKARRSERDGHAKRNGQADPDAHSDANGCAHAGAHSRANGGRGLRWAPCFDNARTRIVKDPCFERDFESILKVFLELFSGHQV